MTLYYSLLKAFLNRAIYLKYKDYLDYDFIKENYPEISKIFFCLPYLHESELPQKSIADLELALFTLYPKSNEQDYKKIFSLLAESTVEDNQIHAYCQGIKQRATASEIAKVALAVGEGQKDFSDLQDILSRITDETSLVETEEDFLDDNLESLLKEEVDKPGLSWPLDSLNRNLGSLRKGDFGFLFARPETGKTTFLTSVVPYMAEQTDKPIVWFNNEERGNKVLLRLYQSVLGITKEQLYSNVPKYQLEYYEKTKRNIKFVYDTALTKQKVERICKENQPSLIIYDQIDKIQGFHKEERNDLDLKAIYIWARNLAQQYAPTIAVCQAGLSGEGKRWLTMGDVDNSKTGKQGEADWILGIGKVQDEGLESVRYLHLSKNKLLGTHAKWEVRIKPEIARYEDF